MGIKEYLKEFWIELWNPDSRLLQYVDRILFILLPLIALAAVLFNRSTVWRDIMSSLIWIIPLVIWGLFALLVIPYRLVSNYKKRLDKAQEQISRLKEEQKPCLTIVTAIRSNYGKEGYSWDLVIKNLGADEAEDCKGTLVDIEFAKPTDGLSMGQWPTNAQLQWADQPLSSVVNKFSIPGLESRNLHVFVNELSERHDQMADLYIAYARDELSRERNVLSIGTLSTPTSAVTVDTISAILVISISSAKRVPIFAVCYLDRKYTGYRYDENLVFIEKNITQEPSINNYRGKLKSKGIGRGIKK
jgi:hypothetical protein